MEVRPVRPEEHEEAGRVTALAYGEFMPEDGSWADYERRLADVASRAGRTLVLVAVEEGRILGSATLELTQRIDNGYPSRPLRPEEAHIRMLGVHPEERRRGVGTALVRACIEEARKAGKSLLTLHTIPRMRAAHRMYESMGFHRGPDRVASDGFRLLAYELPLDATRG